MYKLLIVDDEPLVQIGLQSMLQWSDFDITICGTAFNGKQALEMIQSIHPDIVITDIKMPIMNGLELLEVCHTIQKEPIAFIILTCYEDFPYIKKALKYQAVDYIIKLGLKSEELSSAIVRAIENLKSRKTDLRLTEQSTDYMAMQNYKDKFILKLLHNLFDTAEQLTLQAKQLNLSFQAYQYAAATCIITDNNTLSMDSQQYLLICHNTLSMLSNILIKYIPFHIAALDMKQFCIIFEFDERSPYLDSRKFSDLLQETFQMIHNYFNVTILCTVGTYKESIFHVSDSYQESRQLLPLCSKEKPILFYLDQTSENMLSFRNTFNITILKEDIRKAFEEYDIAAFEYITNSISALFRTHPTYYVQAMDVASNILHLCLTMLPDSESYLLQKFSHCHNSYRSLYGQKSTEKIVDWLDFFSQSIVEYYHNQYNELKNNLILNIEHYIESHITEKLILNDVAALFSISPNYLGQLFKKSTSLGFNEYVTRAKISKAKYLMFHQDLKIYEIADYLGFENSFYFSKVFKKIEGCSPRQYMQNSFPDPPPRHTQP